MAQQMSDVFATVPQTHKVKEFYDSDGKLKALEVLAFLDFHKRDMCVATMIKPGSMRFDHRMPKIVERYLADIVNCIEHVDEYFEGNHTKTKTWFLVKNPMLGEIAPRALIRIGRVQKLLKMIIDLKSGNIA